MPGRILRHPDSYESVLDSYLYIALESPHTSRTAADRFLDAVETTLKRLASMPNMGRTFEPPFAHLPGLAWFPVTGFEDWLLFHRPIEDGIVFYTVIHGARDYRRLLEALQNDDHVD